ncbi:uncharacterized protein BDCG_06115 [Blastomyces dermatitidis ER-3]|uniref:Uncharacterized protein n=1 Tax=Ajellomyces dermatitidis (strain ER-3 / ATCC MYA-2586) TaxID=559297 RepID=A0ABP2F2G1_AJEDR|nr:uncharacterized protein BDCG_06115 [Blastomyces dermatitidis ER-3]EEQ90995.1 hypothetical protein BDCG_06115 [Blastomyces dermatitidis ER-3]
MLSHLRPRVLTSSSSSLYRRRIRLLASTVLFVLFVFYYLRNDRDDAKPLPHGHGHDPQAAVVVAGLRSSNTKWLPKAFPQWDMHIYIADDEPTQLRIPRNKGREAMVYLTYMIDHYDDHPNDTAVLFLHADQNQWHNDDEKYDGKRMLERFNLQHLVREGYVNMRCHPYPGCTTGLDLTAVPTVVNTSEAATIAGILQNAATLFPGATSLPGEVAVGCCAQFGVTARAIRENPLQRYEELRQWLLDTQLSDQISGRVMEYMWHVLFGQPARHCPDPQQCYCQVYGRCNLNCVDGDCGVYIYPFGAGRSWFNRIKDYLGI